MTYKRLLTATHENWKLRFRGVDGGGVTNRVHVRVGVSAWVNRDLRTAVFNLGESQRPSLGPVRLTFNRTSAAAVNPTFGVHAFRAGQNFGFARVNPA